MVIIFRDVVKGNEFLSLSTEKVIELISSNVLNAPFEEKVSKLKLIIVLYYIHRYINVFTYYYINLFSGGLDILMSYYTKSI